MLSQGAIVYEPIKLKNPSEAEMRAEVANVDLVLAIYSKKTPIEPKSGYFNSKWCRAEAHEAIHKGADRHERF